MVPTHLSPFFLFRLHPISVCEGPKCLVTTGNDFRALFKPGLQLDIGIAQDPRFDRHELSFAIHDPEDAFELLSLRLDGPVSLVLILVPNQVAFFIHREFPNGQRLHWDAQHLLTRGGGDFSCTAQVPAATMPGVPSTESQP